MLRACHPERACGLLPPPLGIAASAGATAVINSLTTGAKWPVVISFSAAAIALVLAAAVGIFFATTRRSASKRGASV